MAASDEVSQDEILGLIKKQKGSGHRLESDGECEEDLLEPSASNWFSNRCGGMSNGMLWKVTRLGTQNKHWEATLFEV